MAFHLDKDLVLFRWMLSLFGAASLPELSRHLSDIGLEEYDEENRSPILAKLVLLLRDGAPLTAEQLQEYGDNLLTHTNTISRGRSLVRWKYFQYLSLLFTEIYLDWYFRDREGLLAVLQEFQRAFNTEREREADWSLYGNEDLDKLAFWMATGSGKTLLMHVNILQFWHYCEKYSQQHQYNHTILLCPSEGLGKQHQDELSRSGFLNETIRKNLSGRTGGVLVTDVNKLADKTGDKTYDVAMLEDRNVLFVDEGHRGSSGETWLRYRGQIAEHGFTFEYSATFGQVFGDGDCPEAVQYSKAILFDYSYRYFYEDGYGKDYEILNMPLKKASGTQGAVSLDLYLTAALLNFYQQRHYFRHNPDAVRAFQLEDPLLVFVGNSVMGSTGKTFLKDARSDLHSFMQFLDAFLANKNGSAVKTLGRLLKDKTGLIDREKRDLANKMFLYVRALPEGKDAALLYREIRKLVFNCPSESGRLHVENLRGVSGEIGLRAGENDYFGVVNIGDDTEFVKLCAETGIATGEKQFTTSLFRSITATESTISILLGARKFMEGWDCWRVSMMGLMNVGKQEGSQIIQLFGRGVRLKGYQYLLLRSTAGRLRSTLLQELDDTVMAQRSKGLELLETLTIFGIQASYLEDFQKMLTKEGQDPVDRVEEFSIPVFVPERHADSLKKLKILSLEKKADFETKSTIRELVDPWPGLLQRKVQLDWYPHLSGYRSTGVVDPGEGDTRQSGSLAKIHLQQIDIDHLCSRLIRYKREHGWHQIVIEKDNVIRILGCTDWYELFIDNHYLEAHQVSFVPIWEDIAYSLMKKYLGRQYAWQRVAYESKNRVYDFLSSYENVVDGKYPLHVKEGKNIIDEYKIAVSIPEPKGPVRKWAEELVGQLKSLNREKEVTSCEMNGLVFIDFDRHLYTPLLGMHIVNEDQEGLLRIIPTPLNQGERHFVNDLIGFCESNPDFLESYQLYLLRNRSRGHGIFFAEAGNFYPDFILWVVKDKRQHLVFIDPKGLVKIGVDHDKVRFAEKIKQIEVEMQKNEPDVTLDSFILSVTEYRTLPHVAGETRYTKDELEAKHVLFMHETDDPGHTYLKRLFGMVTGWTFSEKHPALQLVPNPKEAERFVSWLPVYSLQAACGQFGDGQIVEEEGWIAITDGKKLDKEMFVCQAIGDSMKPRINNGDWCIFRCDTGGSRDGKIVLVALHDQEDPEYGGRYTIKEYHSEKKTDKNGNPVHGKIELRPLNKEFEPLVFGTKKLTEGVRVVGVLVEVIRA